MPNLLRKDNKLVVDDGMAATDSANCKEKCGCCTPSTACSGCEGCPNTYVVEFSGFHFTSSGDFICEGVAENDCECDWTMDGSATVTDTGVPNVCAWVGFTDVVSSVCTGNPAFCSLDALGYFELTCEVVDGHAIWLLKFWLGTCTVTPGNPDAPYLAFTRIACDEEPCPPLGTYEYSSRLSVYDPGGGMVLTSADIGTVELT